MSQVAADDRPAAFCVGISQVAADDRPAVFCVGMSQDAAGQSRRVPRASSRSEEAVLAELLEFTTARREAAVP
jgi:hypothetical protein